MADGEIKNLWRSELTQAEVYSVGEIFVLWACLEHEIFVQTLQTYESEINTAVDLPKEMNNIQFLPVLELWKTRVAEAEAGPRGAVLQQQYDEIVELKAPRDALAHGQWDWRPDSPHQVTTTRVKKSSLITTHFSINFLKDMAVRLGEINFKVRFPGGLDELAAALSDKGGYMSRRAMSSMFKLRAE
jgi:hypothetical protein